METKQPKKPSLDPLRRVFVPIEKRTSNGTIVFKTLDNEIYARLDSGAIRRVRVKVRGKAARRAERSQRRILRQMKTEETHAEK